MFKHGTLTGSSEAKTVGRSSKMKWKVSETVNFYF